MKETPAYIPLDHNVRETVKKQKGVLTYSQFIMELIQKK